MDDENVLVLIERFFRVDYQDRGMVKWQGFYLSDHTEDVEKYTQLNQQLQQQSLQPEMALDQISTRLFKAYQQGRVVQYQLKGKDKRGNYAPIQQGRVQGYHDDVIYLQQHAVCLDDIQWCDML